MFIKFDESSNAIDNIGLKGNNIDNVIYSNGGAFIVWVDDEVCTIEIWGGGEGEGAKVTRSNQKTKLTSLFMTITAPVPSPDWHSINESKSISASSQTLKISYWYHKSVNHMQSLKS